MSITTPVRLRLSRAKGFDLQAHSHAINGLPAVNVARPGPWGNPFVVGKYGSRAECIQVYAVMLMNGIAMVETPSPQEQAKTRDYVCTHIDDLRGKNLACWCALDGKPCHADILLRIANSEKRPVDIRDFLRLGGGEP